MSLLLYAGNEASESIVEAADGLSAVLAAVVELRQQAFKVISESFHYGAAESYPSNQQWQGPGPCPGSSGCFEQGHCTFLLV
jgi:hypothetical protein